MPQPEQLSELAGQTIGSDYPLQVLLESTDRGVWYTTTYGTEQVAANVKLIPAEESEASLYLAHDNILTLFDQGEWTATVAGVSLPTRYFVTGEHGKSLATTLEQRPLTNTEAHKMSVAVLDALAFLHENNRVHGRIEACNIYTAGDSYKLSADSLREPKPGMLAGDDVSAFGLTLIEAFAQRRLPTAIGRIPQPFRNLVQQLLAPSPAAKWTARQARNWLASEDAASEMGPAARIPQLPPVEPLQTFTPSIVAKEPPVWIFPVLATGLVSSVIAGVIFWGHHPAPAAPVPQSVEQAKPVEKAKPPVAEAKPPESPAPAPSLPPASATSPAPKALQPDRGWAVVVATFDKREGAEQRAKQLAHHTPSMRLRIVPPSAGNPHYAIVVAAGLSRAKAKAFRDRAVAAGMPKDTFIRQDPASPSR